MNDMILNQSQINERQLIHNEKNQQIIKRQEQTVEALEEKLNRE